MAGWRLSSHSGDCAKLPTLPLTLLRRRRRRPHNPTWLRGRARPQDAGRGGARRKRAAAGPAPGGTTPCAAGLAAPARGPAPFRQRLGCAVRPGLGSCCGAPCGIVPWMLPSKDCCPERRGGSSPPRSCGPVFYTRAALRSVGAGPGPRPRNGSYFINGARPPGLHCAVESRDGTSGRSDALPCVPRGSRPEPQVPAFLQLCPDFSTGSRGTSRPHPVLWRRELAAGCCYTKQTHLGKISTASYVG